MITDSLDIALNALLTQWKQRCGAPDLADKADWARGVVHGITLAIQLIARFASLKGVTR